jgi:hypothetical protein
MARKRRKPGRAPLWGVGEFSGAREKGVGTNQGYSYQEPAQVPLGEKPQVCRINVGKGIRQIGPVTSAEGVPAIVHACVQLQGAITRGARLFNKNLTDCEPEKVCIVGDVCPVPVL